MSDGIYVALSGAIAQAASLDTTATNLANASTDGYQRVRTVFREALATATGDRAVTSAGTSLDTSRGSLRATGNPLDLTLPDRSYLSVNTPRGERYTRAGALSLGIDGTLKTVHGDALLGEDGKEIRAASDQGPVKISASGEVSQGETKLGRLRMVTFASPDQLSPEGAALLSATSGAGTPTVSTGELTVGSLEESNSSVVGAMTELVTAGRAFDAFQRAIDAFHQADQKVVTTVAADS